MLFAHLSARTRSPESGRRARAYQTLRARRLSGVKNMSFFIIGFLIWAAILYLSDPAFLHCNRWFHQSSCAAQSTQR
jgi:hypothetical protein